MDTRVLHTVSTMNQPYGGINRVKATEPKQAVHKVNENAAHGNLKTDSEAAIKKSNEDKQTGPGEETRKIEIKDKKLTVSVYDGKGRLVRVIPPGYLPPNTGYLKMFA